jgi:glycine/D-amino acid oxidase-like deaminating enzyme
MPQSILIVGAGIIGTTLAYRLAKSGAKVTVLDAAMQGGIASAASFGWINATHGNPRPYYKLRRYAMDAWQRVAPDLPELPYMQNGTIYAHFPDSPLETVFDQHSAWGYPLEWISATTIAKLEPNLKIQPPHALLCPVEAQVQPDVAARLFLKSSGARVVQAEATHLLMQGSKITGAATSQGAITADITVLAVGIQTAALAGTVGLNVPLKSPPGLLIHTKPHPKTINHTILTDRLHLQQRPDGTISAGGDFGGGLVINDPKAAATELFARLTATVNSPHPLAFSHATQGLRPTPTDGMPIVGSPAPGLYLAVMHSGATLAPGIAELVTAELTTGHRDPLLSPYHPDRFLSE